MHPFVRFSYFNPKSFFFKNVVGDTRPERMVADTPSNQCYKTFTGLYLQVCKYMQFLNSFVVA